MKRPIAVVAILTVWAASTPAAAQESKTYVGTITDTMCVRDHAGMKMGADPECVRQCVGDAKTYQYALLAGQDVYRLSDQRTPSQFAGRKVRVTGVLYEKTKVLKVERIDALPERERR